MPMRCSGCRVLADRSRFYQDGPTPCTGAVSPMRRYSGVVLSEGRVGVSRVWPDYADRPGYGSDAADVNPELAAMIAATDAKVLDGVLACADRESTCHCLSVPAACLGRAVPDNAGPTDFAKCRACVMARIPD